jgi:hypothetical protein
MRAPRRYRLAVLAYPSSYREARGRELLATLADGDDDRGGPSMREAAALAYRGLQQRAGVAVSGEGLLTIAAVIVLATAILGLTWVERTLMLDGNVAAMHMSGPDRWWAIALVTCAFTVLAAGPFRAADDRRRRTRAALLAFPLALLFLNAPGWLFANGVPSPAEFADYLSVRVQAMWANRTITVPDAAMVAAGTWLLLTVVSELRARARLPVLAVTLAIVSAAAVVATWDRPTIHVDDPRAFVDAYAQSAFADLGTGVFATALAALLALAAIARRESA